MSRLDVQNVLVDAPERLCVHTVYHVSDDGITLGSWAATTGPYGVRFACRNCGKLFGYLPLHADRNDQELYEAYKEQRRLSCDSENGPQ